jgi:NodT family efflux transporter outer membrane factor (OMF) lipoprotein
MQSLALHNLVILMQLTACAVGPDFQIPTPPIVRTLTPHPLNDRVLADGKVQLFVHGLDVPGDWWTLFHSSELTNLMERALHDNHDLKTAQAALRVAQANYEAQKGLLFPVIDANEGSSRQKVATTVLASPTVSGNPFYTLHAGQLTISYVPDVFGGIRRQVEAASAQAESQQFMLEATYLTLTSNIALAAIQEAALNAQITVTQEAVNDERLLYEGKQYKGKPILDAYPRDWAALKAAIAQAEQTIPLLRKQLAAQRDLLTALSGQFAGTGLPEHFHFANLRLPKDLPVVLPSQLVEQRPDVRAAQANLHAAGALIGVAIANRLPLFNLAANIGQAGDQFNNLFTPAPQFLFWTIAGSVTQPIFNGFTLEQRQRAAEAGFDEAAEQYRSTVVTAFQNVADVLQAIELDGLSVKRAKDATAAASKNLCLTVAAFVGYDGTTEPANAKLNTLTNDLKLNERVRSRFGEWWKRVCRPRSELMTELTHPGGTRPGEETRPSGIDVLTAEQLRLATQLNLVLARAARYSDVVALFQALGGGWWNRLEIDDRSAN